MIQTAINQREDAHCSHVRSKVAIIPPDHPTREHDPNIGSEYAIRRRMPSPKNATTGYTG